MAVKTMSDVHIRLKLTKQVATNVQTVAILTSGKDDQVHNYVYGLDDDYSHDFDENTSVNKLIEKAFEVTDFSGVVQVIQAPSSDVPGSKAQSQPSGAGGTVTMPDTNKYVYALMQHINDGFNYVVPDGLSVKDLEAVSDYLYKTQAAMVIAQVKSIDDLRALHDYSSANQKMSQTQLNPVYAIVETGTHVPGVQLAASATANAPVDLMKIGNESEFIPDDDLSVEDIETIKELHGSCVVNKADDMMMLQGYSLGDNYADQFVNTKIVKDTFQYDLQKQLNNSKHLHFDDNGINLLYQTAKLTSKKLFNDGYLDGEADIGKKTYSETSDYEKSTRTYNGLNINAKVMSSIETVNVVLDLLE
ncbi:hypothetical protein MOO46_07570 (plasmid) [Apilactobacillus apisilvae]|uniref:Uncharacterized protein n=1 Tax=Apilactobacillus apisilvae TaxID=2923364 RepID=A0ABY4PK00_9LACO|nr:hypothetical protein [Apilactobacillus apisilvae]UQS85783.1 hypothetical protein MOO46_07570 [Apilactobacillus apisilvae]